MSRGLYWRPIPKKPGGNSLPDPLMFAIDDRMKEIYGGDGLTIGVKTVIGTEWLGWIDGLAYGNVEGAKELAELVRTHGDVEVWTER